MQVEPQQRNAHPTKDQSGSINLPTSVAERIKLALLGSLSPYFVERRDAILSRLKSLTEEACSCNSSSETPVHPAALVANLTEGAQSGGSLSTGLNE
jgi:hypothetical protein